MNIYNAHIMDFVETLEGGTDVFHCSKCGRRILVEWEPVFKKTVIIPGDEYAIHDARKPPIATEEPKDRTLEWEDLLKGMNFEGLWE